MPSIANSNAATKQEIRDVCSMTVMADFAANDGTPDVAAGGSFKTANTVSTTITNFINGYDGQCIRVVIDDANTIVDFTLSSLIGNSGQDWYPNSGDSFTAVRDSLGNWYCQLSGSAAGGGGVGGNNTELQYNDNGVANGIPGFTYNEATTGTALTSALAGGYTLTITNTDSTTASGALALTSGTSTASVALNALSNAPSGIAIYGVASGSQAIALLTQTSSASGRAASFVAASSTGTTYGMHSTNGSSAGFAGYFLNSSITNKEIWIGAANAHLIGATGGVENFRVTDAGIVQATGGINRLTTATGYVDVSASAAPAAGQILVASDANTASWGASVNTVYEDNTGATGLETLALPAATQGLIYIVERVEDFEYRIDPNGTEYFAGSAAGLYKSLGAVGTYICLQCFRTGIWHVTAQFGTVSDE